jgi:hypothetical protein
VQAKSWLSEELQKMQIIHPRQLRAEKEVGKENLCRQQKTWRTKSLAPHRTLNACVKLRLGLLV